MSSTANSGAVLLDGIPSELTRLPRWLCWRYEKRGGKTTKVPYDAARGRRASSTDPATWTDFEVSLAASGRYDGIGIVLGDGLGGVDLDNSLTEDGQLKPWAAQIVERLSSYSEVSPSGRGVKIFLWGSIEREGNRRDLGDGHIEVYSTERYFTVTGCHVPTTPQAVKNRQAEFDALHLELFPPREHASAIQPTEPLGLLDRELLERMFSATNGSSVRRLWKGNIERYPSHSEADAALCAHLAFWAAGDRVRIDRLFRQSQLCREKWTERADYRERTISKALEGLNDTYDPVRSKVPEDVDLSKIVGTAGKDDAADDYENVKEDVGRLLEKAACRLENGDEGEFEALELVLESAPLLAQLKRTDATRWEVTRTRIKKLLPNLRLGELDRRVGGEVGDYSGTTGEDVTCAEVLLRYAGEAELFHTFDRRAFGKVQTADGRRVMQINVRGGEFRPWLVHRYEHDFGRPPHTNALQEALEATAAQAVFAGPERKTYFRIAAHEGNVYVDLGRGTTQAIEITRDGWQVVPEPPVLFERSEALGELPAPDESGNVRDLEQMVELLRCPVEDAYLQVCWLVGALQPGHPFPVLLYTGPAGSGKSTRTRLLRCLIDPAGQGAKLTTNPPRESKDLFAAVKAAHVLAVDNLSNVPRWLSDQLSSIATGAGQITRRLYTDSDVAVVEVKRPMILNGISIAGLGSDLMDRAICIDLGKAQQRQREDELWRKVDGARPRILAALCDCVCAALRHQAAVSIPPEELPRMADFVTWVKAAELALHEVPAFAELDFLELYRQNRKEAAGQIIENDLVGGLIAELASDGRTWSGTSGELLEALEGILLARHGEDRAARITRRKAWPKSPAALGGRLRRIVPQLEDSGIEVEFDRSTGARTIRISKACPF